MKHGPQVVIGILFLSICVNGSLMPAQAESLFRASARFDDAAQPAPHSLFTQPQPKYVGDMVTVLIKDDITVTNTADVKLTKTQTLTENGTSKLNSAFRSVLGNLFFISPRFADRASQLVRVPSFNGLNNANNQSSKTQNSQTRSITDTITCQVVQVMPNGFLQIEGKKVLLAKKEESILYVTGMVNPYFLDKTNQIQSNKVANMEYRLAGRGIQSRQQGDSLPNKIYQFFE